MPGTDDDRNLSAPVEMMTSFVDVLNDIGLRADLRVLKPDPYAEGVWASRRYACSDGQSNG